MPHAKHRNKPLPPSGTRGAERAAPLRPGFTLVDILVSLAIIALLMVLVMPAIGKAMEASKRVITQSNLRQIGAGLSLYANDHHNHLPPQTVYDTHTGFEEHFHPVNIQVLRAGTNPAVPALDRNTSPSPAFAHLKGVGWDGLGHLVKARYLSGEVLYSPGHKGRHTYEAYASALGSERQPEEHVYSNFFYRWINKDRRLIHELDPFESIAHDSVQSQADINHVGGSFYLSVDGAAEWRRDRGGYIQSHLPATVAAYNHTVEEDARWRKLFDAIDHGVFPELAHAAKADRQKRRPQR